MKRIKFSRSMLICFLIHVPMVFGEPVTAKNQYHFHVYDHQNHISYARISFVGDSLPLVTNFFIEFKSTSLIDTKIRKKLINILKGIPVTISVYVHDCSFLFNSEIQGPDFFIKTFKNITAILSSNHQPFPNSVNSEAYDFVKRFYPPTVFSSSAVSALTGLTRTTNTEKLKRKRLEQETLSDEEEKENQPLSKYQKALFQESSSNSQSTQSTTLASGGLPTVSKDCLFKMLDFLRYDIQALRQANRKMRLTAEEFAISEDRLMTGAINSTDQDNPKLKVRRYLDESIRREVIAILTRSMKIDLNFGSLTPILVNSPSTLNPEIEWLEYLATQVDPRTPLHKLIRGAIAHLNGLNPFDNSLLTDTISESTQSTTNLDQNFIAVCGLNRIVVKFEKTSTFLNTESGKSDRSYAKIQFEKKKLSVENQIRNEVLPKLPKTETDLENEMKPFLDLEEQNPEVEFYEDFMPPERWFKKMTQLADIYQSAFDWNSDYLDELPPDILFELGIRGHHLIEYRIKRARGLNQQDKIDMDPLLNDQITQRAIQAFKTAIKKLRETESAGASLQVGENDHLFKANFYLSMADHESVDIDFTPLMDALRYLLETRRLSHYLEHRSVEERRDFLFSLNTWMPYVFENEPQLIHSIQTLAASLRQQLSPAQRLELTEVFQVILPDTLD